MSHGREAAGPVVMVVEDFEDTRRIIALELRRAGYEVVEAGDGVEAVELVKRSRPDMVLMDLSLPGRDGLTAACRMREVEGMCDVPIVACTGHDEAMHGAAVAAAGCDGYLTKPVEPRLLVETVRRMIAEAGTAGRAGDAGARRRRLGSDHMSDRELRDYFDGLMNGDAPV